MGVWDSVHSPLTERMGCSDGWVIGVISMPGLVSPVRLTMNNSEIHIGEKLFRTGNPDGARQCFQAILTNDPDNAAALNDLAAVETAEGDLSSAYRHLVECLNLAPDYRDAVLNFSAVCRLMNASSCAAVAVWRYWCFHPDDGEVGALAAAIGVPRPTSRAVAVVGRPGCEALTEDIAAYLQNLHRVTTCFNLSKAGLSASLASAEIVWIERVDDIAVELTNDDYLLECKRVICRLHPDDMYSPACRAVRWEKIHDVVLDAPYVREYMRDHLPTWINDIRRIHVIPRGINLSKYPFRARGAGKNLAFIGDMEFRGGPMLLVQAFAGLIRRNAEYQLHIAGHLWDDCYPLYFMQMASELGLRRQIHFDGCIDDVPRWLADKHYLISTSLSESPGVGIREAMACGVKPVIHNFIGARSIYDSRFLWNTVDEFAEMIIHGDYHSEEYRRFVERDFSYHRQGILLDALFLQVEKDLNGRT